MNKAIRIYEYGGPEVMRWEEHAPGAPGPGEALVKHTAIGVNFADVYARKGAFPAPIPGGLGSDAAGVVEAVGDGVDGLREGDRVTYFMPTPGSYAERRVCPAGALIPLTDSITDETAAATLTKGITARFLLRETFVVSPGDVVLLHAAAGGLGLIASAWAGHLGATVIGVVSSDAKAQLAKEHGCAHVVVGIDALVDEVKEITGGRGADVVYDSVGKDTFMLSLDCLKPRGMLVHFGNASGPPPEFSPMELMKRGSLYLTRPGGADYIGNAEAVRRGADGFFELVKKGIVRVHIGQRYALADAAVAHRDLEARKTVGSTLLVP